MSFLDTFKSSMLEIIEEAKKGNTDFANELSDRLFDWLDQEFETRLNFNLVHSAIENISVNIKALNKSILFTDEKTATQVERFYNGLPQNQKNLKKRLIEARKKMHLHIRNENFKEACKYLVVQAEMLSQHLVVAFDIIAWIKRERVASVTVSEKIKNNQKLYYLRTWELLKAVDIRFKCQWNQPLIEEVKNIRDFESHGYHDDDAKEMELLVTKISSDWEKYFLEWTRFINILIDSFYSS